MKRQLKIEDFDAININGLIVNQHERVCHAYSSLFANEANRAKTETNNDRRIVFEFLRDVTSFDLSCEPSGEPFQPISRSSQGRSSLPCDFNEDDLNLIESLIPIIKDPELRARFADMLWVRRRDYRNAQLAVRNYLQAASCLDNTETYHPMQMRLNRALSLAASLDKNSYIYFDVVQHIEDTIECHKSDDSLFVCAELMEALQNQRIGDPIKYGVISGELALRAEKELDFYRAQRYWRIKANWHYLDEDSIVAQSALVQEAEAYYKEARRWLDAENPSYLNAAGSIERSIHAYRKIGGHKDRIRELRVELLNVNKKSISEMNAIKIDLHLEDIIENTISRIRGKPFTECISILARMVQSLDIEDLEKSANESIKQPRISDMIGAGLINPDGKTIARKAGLYEEGEDSKKAWIRAEMINHVNMHYVTSVRGIVDTARRQILMEHCPDFSVFWNLSINSPFIPHGREHIFAKGLYAGLIGDFITAGHLLISQLENSFRYVLSQHNVITSQFDDEGIQEEIDINIFIRWPEFERVFSKDLTFDLQTLLVERVGGNLRNRLAHGLMRDIDFYSEPVIYAWWLTLSLCLLPLITREEPNLQSEHEDNDKTNRKNDNKS